MTIKNVSAVFGMSAVVLLASFMLVSSAFAASVTNVEFGNGDVTIQGNAGQSVSGKVRITVPVGEEVERVEFDVLSDSLAPHCKDVGRLQEGTHFVNIDGVKFPPNTGTFDLNVTAHGIYGSGMAAIDCENNQVASASFGGSIRTVGGSSTSVGSPSSFDQLMAQIAGLQAQISCMVSGGTYANSVCTPKPVNTKPAFCTSMPPVNSWSTKMEVSVLQSWMVANGFMTSAQMSTGPGIYGPKTTAAHFAAQAACR